MAEVTRFENAKSVRLTTSASTTVKRDIRIVGKGGLTMLTCSRLVEQLSTFAGEIAISNGVITVDGRSVIDMLRLAAVSGAVLSIELTGVEANRMMQRIATLLVIDG